MRQACARHLRDLVEAPARGLRWSVERAAHALAFFPTFLRLHEGEHAGQPFVLQPWQAFILGALFGWLNEDGSRRFRTAYIEAGKGNGKTPLLAGVGLYGLVADGEAGAQIYPAAVTREQAGLLFADAKAMAHASPSLAARLEILEHNLADPGSGSFFRPVSSEGRSLDGKRVHMALIDEIHEHPDATVVDKLRAGTKGRRQALICEITNSGYDRHSVCWQHHDYSLKVVDQVLDNDAWFAYVCALDPCDAHASLGVPQEGCRDCDDWTDERVWCLSGDTKVYAKIGRGPTVCTLDALCEDMTTTSAEVWDGRAWVRVLGASQAARSAEGQLRLTLRSGQRISCTAHHEWPTQRGKVRADGLRLGDVLATAMLPDHEGPPAIPADIGWLVGLYLAEGSQSGATLQLAGHAAETTARLKRLRALASAYGGSARGHVYGNRGTVNVESPVLLAMVGMYVGGRVARDKYLRPAAWRQSNAFLREVATGYLEGDGSYDQANDRYRLGFCRNDRLADSLRTIAARVGARVRLATGHAKYQRGTLPTYRGEWRWSTQHGARASAYGEIVEIRKSNARRFWHIGVENADGLFALASGVLTHNSKANPNLGVSVTAKYLAEQVREAQDLPGKRAIVRRLNFCAWNESEVRWLSPEAWAACGAPVDAEALRGRPCIAGLDLSTKIDLTALVLLFPREDDEAAGVASPGGLRSTRSYDVLCHFWAPAETVAERVRRDRVPYDLWARQGHLELTDGNVIDHRAIHARVLEYASRYDLREVAYDPYSATMLVSDLQDDGLPCVEVRQGAKSLGEATKQLEVLVRDRGLRHGNHPVLRWCAANVVVELDRNGNYLASKRRSTERIDGISALITALARAMVLGEARSVYETRGLVVL